MIECTQIREKLKDIPNTNFQLGLYHLTQGNLRDAILRFRLVTKLDNTHAEAYYYLAQALALSEKPDLAADAAREALSLKHPWEEAQFVLDKCTNPNAIDTIPSSIIRDSTTQSLPPFSSLTPDEKSARVRFTTKHIFSYITDKNPNLDVLDIGTQTYGYCYTLRKREFAKSIDAITPYNAILSKLRQSQYEGEEIFNQCSHALVHQFLNQPIIKTYDLIIADRAFDFYGKLEPLFLQTYNLLNPNGMIAFIFPVLDDRTRNRTLDKKNNHFIFNLPAIENALQSTGFRKSECLPIPKNIPTSSASPTLDSDTSSPQLQDDDDTAPQHTNQTNQTEYLFIYHK